MSLALERSRWVGPALLLLLPLRSSRWVGPALLLLLPLLSSLRARELEVLATLLLLLLLGRPKAVE